MEKDKLLDKQEEFCTKVQELINDLYKETGMMVTTIDNNYVSFPHTDALVPLRGLDVTYKMGKDYAGD